MPDYKNPGSFPVVEVFTVGTSEVQLTPADKDSLKVFHFKAPLTNTDAIYLGVTGITGADDGYPLQPGETTPYLQMDSPAEVYAISDAADQKLVLFGIK